MAKKKFKKQPNSNPQDANQVQDRDQLHYVSQERLAEISALFDRLQINTDQQPYQSAGDFSMKLQRASALQFQGIVFTTSSSTNPFPK